MYWTNKYNEAILRKKQLIGDKVLRKFLRDFFHDVPLLEEVRFPNFTADMLFIFPEQTILMGIEVKSDRDSLLRLPYQLDGYLSYCNKVVVATTIMHAPEALKILEDERYEHVGLWVYRMEQGEKFFNEIKEPVCANLLSVNSKWISRKHQLYQWLYMLEVIWDKWERRQT